MNLFWTILFVTLSSSKLLFGEISSDLNAMKYAELKTCFEHCWGMDSHTSVFIGKYFKTFLESEEGCFFLDDFIAKSLKQDIQFPIDQDLTHLSHDDGVVQATKFHPIIFESPYVRILAGCAAPGEREPFHSHSWKSLLVVFEEAKYKIEYKNGSDELLYLEPGVYELPPEDLYACTNLGTKRENCLRFEVKDIQKSDNSLSTDKDIPMFDKDNLEAFEAQIAYFFGVPDPQPVKEAYINALKQIEVIGSHSTDMLQKKVSPYLEEAYQSIAKQRNWSFDIHLAAQIELEIILGNINGASFEKISDLMVQLYTLVFQSDCPKILKAAWLRTFLYQYKTEIIEKEGQISQQDYNLMLNMAKTSEEFLSSIK